MTQLEVAGLPPEMGIWIWQYSAGHGYSARHAYAKDNPERSLPYRQILAIRRNPQNYQAIEASAQKRRDVPLEIKYKEFQHKSWIETRFQFSTGAKRFLNSLPDNTRTFITASGVPRETYDIDENEPEIITRSIAGYSKASIYRVPNWFYEQVTLRIYEIFEALEYVSVYQEVVFTVKQASEAENEDTKSSTQNKKAHTKNKSSKTKRA